MESFEELGLSPTLTEALAAEGIEHPTAIQTHAIPVLRRGNPAVVRGAPGSGTLVAYGAALLDRFEPGGNQPRAIVLAPQRERARALAISLARIATGTGHRIGALGTAWALPERSDILFATPGDLQRAIRSAEVKTEEVRALVIDGASILIEDPVGDSVLALLAGMDPDGAQLTLVSDRLTPAIRQFVDQHMKRAVFLPPEAAASSETPSAVHRGVLNVRTLEGGKEDALPALVSEILAEETSHVLAYFRSEDRAADFGDLLGLRGFIAGAPGDPELPVWLGVAALEARHALQDRGEDAAPVVTVSVDVPVDADELDRRHGGSSAGGIVLAHPRELPHVQRIAREAGYSVEPHPPRPIVPDEQASFLAKVEEVFEAEDLVPYLLLLEPSIRRRGAAEVAAALALLLRRRQGAEAAASGGESARPGEGAGARPPAFVRLFISVGERDGVGPGDLLGAIIGESGVTGEQVGRIDLRDTFSKVEVQESVADKVIRALNGTSIRGRSMRVDFDRGDGRAQSGGPGVRGPRPEGGKPRGPSGPVKRRPSGKHPPKK